MKDSLVYWKNTYFHILKDELTIYQLTSKQLDPWRRLFIKATPVSLILFPLHLVLVMLYLSLYGITVIIGLLEFGVYLMRFLLRFRKLDRTILASTPTTSKD